MKESRFIELLNLYVDQQLSRDEAVELETEIAGNAQRRRTYLQYCRMQKACTLLFEKERVHAPATPKLAAAVLEVDRKVIAFPTVDREHRRNFIPIGIAAALVASAALFFVMGRQSASSTVHGSAPLASAPTHALPSPAEVDAITSVAAAQPAFQQPEFYPVLSTRRLTVASNPSPDDLGGDMGRDEIASYAWMRDVELSPVQTTFASERITLQPASSSAEPRVLRSRKPVQGATEMTAFQFQR